MSFDNPIPILASPRLEKIEKELEAALNRIVWLENVISDVLGIQNTPNR